MAGKISKIMVELHVNNNNIQQNNLKIHCLLQINLHIYIEEICSGEIIPVEFSNDMLYTCII